MKKTILLLEDDYSCVASVKQALDSLDSGYELHVAHNGVDALALLNGNSVDEVKVLPGIILLDTDMPQMNGLEFLGIIKNYYSLKNISIYVMAASLDEYDMVAAHRPNVSGYLLKPLDFKNSAENIFSESAARLKDELCTQPLKTGAPVFATNGFGALKPGFFHKTWSPKKMFTGGAGLAGLSIVVLGALGLMFYEGNHAGRKKTIQPVLKSVKITEPVEKTPGPVTPEIPATVNAPLIKTKRDHAAAAEIISVVDTLRVTPTVPKHSVIRVTKSVAPGSESPDQKTEKTGHDGSN